MNLKNLVFALVGSATLCAAAVAESPAPAHYVNGHAVYGEHMPTSNAPLPLAKVLMHFEDFTSDAVFVSGRIGQVCQKKGCWMMLTDEGVGARVRFGDHAFAIPKDSTGKALVLGTLRAIEMSEGDAKHMAKDGGEDPDQVQGPRQEWELMATSVLIMAES